MPRPKVNRKWNSGAFAPYRPPSRNRVERIAARHEQLAKMVEAITSGDDDPELLALTEAVKRSRGGG